MTQIHSIRADASLNIRAEEIRSGRRKTRIQLGTTKSSSVAIAAYVINNPLDRLFSFGAVKSKRFVKTKIDNKTILINVNSASKRLHLEKRQVRHVNQDNYISLLCQRAEKIEHTLKNYHLFNQEHGDKGLLTPSTLMDLVHKTLDSDIQSGINLDLTKTSKLVAIHHKQNEVRFAFTKKLIASGGAAHVYVLSSNQSPDLAYKTAKLQEPHRKKSIDADQRTFEKEIAINKKLNREGPQPGIMLPIYLAKPFNKDNQGIGIIMQNYDQGDYFDVCIKLLTKDLFKKQKITIVKEFEQLLFGLAYIHNQGIVHGDLKPENITLKDERVDIIDFGGAAEEDKADLPYTNFCTSDYIYADDKQTLDSLKKTDIKAHYVIGRKMDVFALGSVFYARLGKTLPYAFDSDGYQSGKMRIALPAFIPLPLKTLLAHMTHTDFNKRISALDGFKLIRKYRIDLELKQNELKEKI